MSGGVFEEMFGDELCAKGGEVVQTSAALADKVVAIYFSAHWCPPCRGFTPELAKAYATYKAAGKNLEIVFASSDRDEKAFGEYFAEMPWLALPFSERDRKEKLSSKFKGRGIPTLVILDTDGSVITTDGRSAVSEDPTAPRSRGSPSRSQSSSAAGSCSTPTPRAPRCPSPTSRRSICCSTSRRTGARRAADSRRNSRRLTRRIRRRDSISAHLRFVRPRRVELRRVLRREAVARAPVRRPRPQERALQGV